ncbi:sugar phosphate isomerase/epimerase family protein [Shouchella shacheensis]|uniref:sugar phosphate isomerase/epimerase family protein n=1 Tax=Shouchella shacheensis TaxID=1649580 RepID=UPI00073FC379|nr:sugar phosphate isomerase/epimerase [Shouchella shacheensis]
MMQLGISSYTYTWAVEVPGFPVPETPLTVPGLIDKAIEQEVKVVQIADNLPLHQLTERELQHCKKYADQAGIHLEVGTRGIEADLLLTYLDIAKTLGSPFVRTIIHMQDGTPSTQETITLLQKIMPAYEKAGVDLAIENHDRHTVDELIEIIEAVGSSRVGICLDTVNSFGALEAPDYVVQQLAPYTLNVHIKDFTVDRVQSQMGFSVVGCAAGEGMLDIDQVLERLSLLGREPNVILELWTPFEDSIEQTLEVEEEWANRSITFLKERLS